jgi:hypothetical protein
MGRTSGRSSARRTADAAFKAVQQPSGPSKDVAPADPVAGGAPDANPSPAAQQKPDEASGRATLHLPHRDAK